MPRVVATFADPRIVPPVVEIGPEDCWIVPSLVVAFGNPGPSATTSRSPHLIVPTRFGTFGPGTSVVASR